MSDLLQYIGMQGPGNSFLYKKKKSADGSGRLAAGHGGAFR
jgi:hypothetical protein